MNEKSPMHKKMYGEDLLQSHQIIDSQDTTSDNKHFISPFLNCSFVLLFLLIWVLFGWLFFIITT